MTVKLIGTVKNVLPAETKGTFEFRNLWLTIDQETQYPQVVEVQFTKDKIAVLDAYNAGDKVEVEANIRGREYNGKVYVSLTGWKINKTGSAQPAGVANQRPVQNSDVADDSDGLPF